MLIVQARKDGMVGGALMSKDDAKEHRLEDLKDIFSKPILHRSRNRSLYGGQAGSS